jgi:uncharacterized protein (TIGR03083 family)
MADVALLRTALGDLATVLDSVTDEESRQPSGCRGWSVLDLAYHLVEDAHRTLVDLNSPADGPADTDDVEYWRPGRPSPHDGEDAAIAAGIRERVGDLARRHREACAAVLVAVGRVRLDDVVRGQGVAMTVADELSHYVVEAAIHHLDLVAHLDRPGPAAGPLAEVRRVLQHLLGQPFPPGWDDATAARRGTGREPLPAADRVALGPLTDRFPLFG